MVVMRAPTDSAVNCGRWHLAVRGARWGPGPWRCHVAKVLKCGELMPGCDTVIEGKDAEEVLAKAEAHARKEHNMTIILPSTITQMERAIRDKA
jgi:predicted small metal-binding protein